MDLAQLVGRRNDPVETTIERGSLRLFARAVGDTSPVHLDVAAARAAGHPDLLVPLTYLFGLELQARDPFWYLTELGVDLRALLHGEQEFEYLSPVHAGDVVRVAGRIVDAYRRKGGALLFLVRESVVSRSAEPVARLRSTWVVRSSREGSDGAA